MDATLPDYIAANLRVLSIGLNPSLPSVRAGFYFANPRNRFWAAFHASGLTQLEGEPSANYHRILLEQGKIGFTDIVKRPSRQGHELRRVDYKEGAPRLLRQLENYQPQWAWVHGKVAYRNFLKYAMGETPKDIFWGEQQVRIARTRVFVTPNPSPANAVWSLADLRREYQEFARHVAV